MGEVGGYQLHLYCDHPKHDATNYRSPYVSGFGEFYGARSLTQARRSAHRAGWRKRSRLSVTNGIEPAWACPDCVNLIAPIEPEPREEP